MIENDRFETGLADSQATAVEPVSPGQFDAAAYAGYEQRLMERCKAFWKADSGVLVCRRMRVAEVFSFDSRSMEKSLAWQLGGLKRSMDFKADVPNFLEPWYGIGTVAGAFGLEYAWHPGQAPAVSGKFPNVRAALDHGYKPVDQTGIGRHTLEMVEYFLEKTRGMIPLSYCDVQSPLNISENIVDINGLMTDLLLDPESVGELFGILSDLMVDFTRIQKDLVGEALVYPGHGFASSRYFEGFGMSDDLSIMLPDDLLRDMAIPCFEKTAGQLGGGAFHSCGNWSQKIAVIKQIKGLLMVDGAFSKSTDPDPNPPEPFANGFADTGIVVNARIVGGPELVVEKVKKLWRPGMKLIVVTYCKTPEEQEQAYHKIHEICQA